jgi:hypothetical protein
MRTPAPHDHLVSELNQEEPCFKNYEGEDQRHWAQPIGWLHGSARPTGFPVDAKASAEEDDGWPGGDDCDQRERGPPSEG